MSSGCLLLFALPFAAVGVVMSVLVVLALLRGNAAKSWEEVPAKILSAELEVSRDSDGGSTERARATYEYVFRGETYRGDRVSFHGGSDNIGSYQRDAAAELKRYLASGEPFRCYVDPDSPEDSVIYREIRWGMIGFMSVFGIVFGGVGFGVFAFGLAAKRGAKKIAVLKGQRPDAPWLWREDWASGGVRSSSLSLALPLCIAALFVNLIAWPVFFGAIVPQLKADGGGAALFGLALPVAGVGLVLAAGRSVARRRKFGETRFDMASVPGVVGGRLAGVVHVERHLDAPDGFVLQLRCVRRVVERSGNKTSTSESIVWETERRLRAELLPGDRTRTAIPVLFGVPFDKPESDQGAGPGYRWELEVSAATPGVDFRAEFVVPVFKTAESSEEFVLDEAPLAGVLAEEDPVRDFATEGVRLERGGMGGERYIFPPCRHLGGALALTAFWLIWTGISVFLWFSDAPWIFPLVFGFFSVLLTLGVAGLWLATRSLRISSSALWVASGWLLRGRERRIGLDELEAVGIESDMQIGSRTYVYVRAELVGGAKRRLSGRFRKRWLAERLVARIEEFKAGRAGA